MRQESRRLNAFDILLRFTPAIMINLALSVWAISPLATVLAAPFMPALPASASCAQLSRVDPTATNGAKWGATLLPGFGADGGWFGVPVCANSINKVAPGGANLSCDRTPSDFPATGCAPGGATSDGYGLTFQCVELVTRFSAWAFGSSLSSWRGDAQYLWLSGHHPASFSAYPNGGSHMPLPGDILVWGSLDRQGHPWPSGPAGGHVAVVAAVSPGRISFVEENMLVRGDNIPEETTTLTQSGGIWRIGPTYGTNGGRALYGWLHEAGSTGRFKGSGSQPATVITAPSAPSTRPSLAGGVIVTGAGELAQLVWSDTHTASPSPKRISANSGNAPHTLVESLGTPPGVTLVPNQTPAVVTLPGGERYTFALGQDGRLYAAYTPGNAAVNEPTASSVLWQALGAPTGRMLTSAATALWDGVNIVVGALGSDGAVWVRSGPPGMLDSWISLGQPSSAKFRGFQGTPVFIRAPGSPATSATSAAPNAGAVEWLALAIGRDGALYENDGSPANASSSTPTASSIATNGATPTPSQVSGWRGWTQTAIPGLTAPLTGPLLVVPEPQIANSHQHVSAAPAVGAMDALAMDTTSHLWLLRRDTMSQPWQARPIQAPDAGVVLLSATLAPPASGQKGAATLVVYVTDPQVTASHASAQPVEQGIFTNVLPLTAASASQMNKWELLGFAPPAAPKAALSAEGAPVALELGSGLRTLLLARGALVTLIGDTAALNQLVPGARSAPTQTAIAAYHTATSAPSSSGIGTVTLGAIAPASVFSDVFSGSALDPRWLVTGAPPGTVQVEQGALSLSAATSSDRVEIAQGAPSDPFTVSVQVIPDASWRVGMQASGSTEDSAQAGIRLALDDWNTLTLSVRSDGTVAFCPIAAGKAQTCDTAPAPTTASPSQKITLRLTQVGGKMTGAISVDRVNWTLVGSWSLPWIPSAEAPLLGAYAPPVAPVNMAASGLAPNAYAATPLAFTSLGLFVEGASTHSSSGRQATGVTTGASAQFSAITVTANTNVAP